jgi:membrane protein DedA with SNARE-associated domain
VLADSRQRGKVASLFVSVPANLGYGVLAALVGGESAGLPIPGETALVTAGLLAAAGHLSVPLVIVIAALAAMAGDNLGYWLGRHAGRRALQGGRGPLGRHRRRLLVRGEAFFARHGVNAVFLGRFVVGVRVVAALVAGATRMPIRQFMLANAAGAVVWAAATTLLVVWLGPPGAVLAFASSWVTVAVGLLVGVVSGRVALAPASAPEAS